MLIVLTTNSQTTNISQLCILCGGNYANYHENWSSEQVELGQLGNRIRNQRYSRNLKQHFLFGKLYAVGRNSKKGCLSVFLHQPVGIHGLTRKAGAELCQAKSLSQLER